MTDRSSILKDSLGALLVRGAGIVLMFGSTTITARLLGPDVYGTYASALSLSMLLATLIPLGTDRVLANRLSVSSGQQHSVNEIALTLHGMVLTGGFVLSIMVSILGIGIVAGMADEWYSMLHSSLLLFIPLTMLYLRQWIAIPLVGARKAMVTDQILIPLLFSAALVAMISQADQLTATLTAGLYAGCILLALGISLSTGPLRPLYQAALKSSRHTSRHEVMGRLRQGVPFVAVSTGAVICQTCMPLMIAAICGFQESAYFALAAPFAALPLIPLGVLNLSLIPTCSRYHQAGCVTEAEHTVRTAATLTFYTSAVISLGLWLCSPLLSALFGAEYRAVAGLLPPLLLAAMVDCLTGPTVPVMQSMGMERFYSRALLIFVPIQLMLVSVAGRVSGVEGTAFAVFGARCLWNIIVGWKVYQVLGLRMLPLWNFLILFPTNTKTDNSLPSVASRFSLSGSVPGNAAIDSQTRAA